MLSEASPSRPEASCSTAIAAAFPATLKDAAVLAPREAHATTQPERVSEVRFGGDGCFEPSPCLISIRVSGELLTLDVNNKEVLDALDFLSRYHG